MNYSLLRIFLRTHVIILNSYDISQNNALRMPDIILKAYYNTPPQVHPLLIHKFVFEMLYNVNLQQPVDTPSVCVNNNFYSCTSFY